MICGMNCERWGGLAPPFTIHLGLLYIIGVRLSLYSLMATITLPSNELRLITASDYHRMTEVGILAADEHVELIAGQIIQKMPKGPAHSALCKRVENY